MKNVRDSIHLPFVLALTVAPLAACSDDDVAERHPGPPVPMRIAITPNGALLTPGLPSRVLAATVRDRLGQVLSVPVQWTSSAPHVIDVDGAGRVTALTSVGSAVITAKAGAARGEVLIVAAEPAAGAVVIGDENVASPITPADPTAHYGVGFQYEVTLAGVAPPSVGSLIMSSGEEQVSGRVIAVNGNVVTVEVVPLDELFVELDLSASLDLRHAQFGIPPEIEAAFAVEQHADGSFLLTPRVTQSTSPLRTQSPLEFGVGPFQCELTGSLFQMTLASPQVTFAPNLSLDLVWSSELKKLVVNGDPTLTIEVTPLLAAAATGELTCKLKVYEIYLPFPGVIGAVLGAVLPFGPGFTLEGEIPIGGVGAKYSAEASAHFRFGFECNPGCAGITELDSNVTGDIEPIWPEAWTGLRGEIGLAVFMFTDLTAGLRFDPDLRVEIAASQSGLAFEATVAGEETQVEDTSLKGEYDLKLAASAGAGLDFQYFLDLVSIDVASFELSFETPLGTSPKAVEAKADRTEFQLGDQVTFRVKLDQATLELPLYGYNVAAVRIYRKTSSGLEFVNDFPAASGQWDFELPWIATSDGTVEGNFFAFVSTNLIGAPRLEIADVVPDAPGAASVTCEHTVEVVSHWADGAWTKDTHTIDRRTLALALELLSSSNGLNRFTVTGGSANVSVEYDYEEHHPGQGNEPCTYSETITDHYSGSASAGASGQAAILIRPDGTFSIDAGNDASLEVTTQGLFKALYSFTGSIDTCRSPVSDPYEDTSDEWVEIEVDGAGTPGEEHHFTATEVQVNGDTTTTTTCTFNL